MANNTREPTTITRGAVTAAAAAFIVALGRAAPPPVAARPSSAVVDVAVSVAVSAARARVAARPFEATKKFDGSIEGMVYRTGTDGMGYYPDVPAITPALLHQELFPLAGIAPVQLCLQTLLSTTAADDNRQPQPQTTTTANTTKAPRKLAVGPNDGWTQSRGLRRSCIEWGCDMEEEPHDTEWPQHDVVAVWSQQHRTDGNWAIDTVNPDGWSNILDFLKTTSADFVIGQGAKRAYRPDCDTAESAARTAGWKASLTQCLHSASPPMPRASLPGWSSPLGLGLACRMLTRSPSPSTSAPPDASA